MSWIAIGIGLILLMFALSDKPVKKPVLRKTEYDPIC